MALPELMLTHRLLYVDIQEHSSMNVFLIFLIVFWLFRLRLKTINNAENFSIWWRHHVSRNVCIYISCDALYTPLIYIYIYITYFTICIIFLLLRLLFRLPYKMLRNRLIDMISSLFGTTHVCQVNLHVVMVSVWYRPVGPHQGVSS